MIRKRRQDQKSDDIDILYNKIINEKDKRMTINNINTLYDEITDEKKEKS